MANKDGRSVQLPGNFGDVGDVIADPQQPERLTRRALPVPAQADRVAGETLLGKITEKMVFQHQAACQDP